MTTDSHSASKKSDSSLLERGELALRAIHLRKRAAEFEAVAAELEAAVLLAKQGQSTALESWMTRFGGGEFVVDEKLLAQARGFSSVQNTDSLSLAVQTSSSPVSCSPTSNESFSASKSIDSNTSASPWSSMLIGAEQRAVAETRSTTADVPAPKSIGQDRLAEGQELGATSLSSSDSKPAAADTKPSSPAQPTRSKSGRGEPAKSEVKLKRAGESADKKPTSTRTTAQGSKVNEARVKAIATALEANGDAKSHPNVRLAWLGSSWGSSLVVHLVLVLALFFVTIQMAEEKVLSIASASMEGPEVLMEEPMEFDPELPEEISDEVPAPAAAQFSSLTSTEVSATLPDSVVGTLAMPEPAPTSGSAVSKVVNMTGASSKVANVQFFGVQAEGNTFCYIVDSSGSMRRDGAFDAAKSELMRSLSTMKPTQRFYVFFFSEEVESLTLEGKEPEPFPVYATPENLQKTLAWVQRVQIRGGKPPNDALEKAIEMDPDGIFLLFDGDTKVDVAAHLRKVNRSYDIISGEAIRVPIHTIGFFTQNFEALMKRIAEENLGTYRFVPKPATSKK